MFHSTRNKCQINQIQIASRRNRETAKKLKTTLHSDVSHASYVKTSEQPKPQSNQSDSDEESKIPDYVKLGEEGWKDRYFLQKFHVSDSDEEFRRQ